MSYQEKINTLKVTVLYQILNLVLGAIIKAFKMYLKNSIDLEIIFYLKFDHIGETASCNIQGKAATTDLLWSKHSLY